MIFEPSVCFHSRFWPLAPSTVRLPRIRTMPPDRGVLAQDICSTWVEAASDRHERPRRLTVVVNGTDITSQNDAAADRGAPPNSLNCLPARP